MGGRLSDEATVVGVPDEAVTVEDDTAVVVPFPPFEPLEPGEEVLDDENEHYLRQCNPSWVQGGKPSSQAFAYFAKDAGRLSGSRSRDATPAQAYRFYTETLRLKSAATLAVTVAQVEARSSRVVDDTNAPTVRPPAPVPPGHSYIDLRHLTSGERKRLASGLSRDAVQVHPDTTNQMSLPDDAD